MLDDGSIRYPSPLVRLLLMRAVADKLGLNGTYALRGMMPADFLCAGPVVSKTGRDLRDGALADIARIDAIATAVVGPIPEVGELKQLMVFRADDFTSPAGFVHLWAETLVGRKQMVPHNELRHARLVLRSDPALLSCAAEAMPTRKYSRRRKTTIVRRPCGSIPGGQAVRSGGRRMRSDQPQ
jgi:hypothetical protein